MRSKTNLSLAVEIFIRSALPLVTKVDQLLKSPLNASVWKGCGSGVDVIGSAVDVGAGVLVTTKTRGVGVRVGITTLVGAVVAVGAAAGAFLPFMKMATIRATTMIAPPPYITGAVSNFFVPGLETGTLTGTELFSDSDAVGSSCVFDKSALVSLNLSSYSSRSSLVKSTY